MPPDCYKVEVLHLHNPHLMWVEVRNCGGKNGHGKHAIKFEQIGIYGVLPLETSIELDEEEITVQRCHEWLPASATVMRKFLVEDEDILFNPIHVERRSSIFDDNIHKFGDLLVKKRNGKTKSLTNVLKTSGFAMYDECLFHTYLSDGKIHTKLNNIETQQVLTEIEKYFINKNMALKKYEPISKHTSIARVSCEYEEAIIRTNHDKNNKNIREILENKYKVLDLCKGVDEPSLGRATTRKGKEKKTLSPVEQKLDLLHAYKTKADSKTSESGESKSNEQAFEDTKMYLEANACPYTKKISSKTDAHKAQILKKVMSKTALKKHSKQEKLENRLLIESEEKNKVPEVMTVQENKATSESNSSNICVYVPQQDFIQKPEETNQLKTAKTVASVQNVFNENKTNSSSDSNNENSKSESVKKQNTSLKEDHKNFDDLNSDKHLNHSQGNKALKTSPPLKEESKNATKVTNSNEINRHPSKGRGSKKSAKVEVYIPTLESEESSNESKNKDTSKDKKDTPQPRLAYPPQKANKIQEFRNHRRVPALPFEQITAMPACESKVNEFMTTYHLTGSKHSDMIESAVRKYKEGVKDQSEAIKALGECRKKIENEIEELELLEQLEMQEELETSKRLADIDLDLHISQTFSKTKLKKKGKKYNVFTSIRTNTIYGPPGVDLSSLSRVPPVLMYGEENSMTNKQKADIMFNRLDFTVADKVPPKSSEVDKNTPNVVKTEPVKEDKKTQETVMKKQGNLNKETSSSSSSVWERRLKLHKEMSKNKRSTTNASDTTVKDSSSSNMSSNVENSPPKNFVEKNTAENSDESISEIVEKLAKVNNKNSTQPVNLDNKNSDNLCLQVAIKANPFQNFDINNSIFVDNLVTPILMVHSKTNKRILPTCNFREIFFTDHIRLVLRNFRVERPMMIQSITWNAILKGHSVFMIGQPGSGKTFGYLPSVCSLVTDFNQSESFCDSVGPFCIIVCATSQSVSEIERIAKMLVGCDERVVSCYYGHDELAIATSLLNGCHLLICTAPSLVRLLQMPDFGVDLQRLATFVLDDCERLSEVYATELKFCLYKIREMQKTRVNRELLVQYVVSSRIWCDFMESFAKKAPDSVVCIGAFQECVLYAKSYMTVSYVNKDNKPSLLLDFLQQVDPSKRSVVVCNSDDEVDYLSHFIHNLKYFVFPAYSTMSVTELYNLSLLWNEFSEPLMAPILVCCDDNLYHMNVTDASYLVHYSLPSMFSTFSRRFATLNERFPSIFRKDNECIKILILLDENNVNQLPKIVNFVKRCTNNVPEFLDDVCTSVLARKDIQKAVDFAPLCNTLMSLGECPDFYYCKSRHTILSDYDEPKEWMPKSGLVTFKILHYHSAACYSARLISNLDVGTNVKYSSSYSSMSLKMGLNYSNKNNRIPVGIPKLGDICAVALGNNLFVRCQIIKIIDQNQRGNSKNVLVNLIDEERMEMVPDTSLYYLPNDLKNKDTYVVLIRLANIQPRDKDIVFSEIAKEHVMKLTNDLKKGMYMKGKIVLTVANCIFIDTLEVCQDLRSLNETVVLHNVKRELLEKHAEVNPNHLIKIDALCERGEWEIQCTRKQIKCTRENVNPIFPSVKTVVNLSWAHLEQGMSLVDFGTVLNPDTLFVRHTKFEDCMRILFEDIKKYVSGVTCRIDGLIKGEIVLAEYPDDGVFERARIDEIGNEKVKCFFLDEGEWRYLEKDKFIPITDRLITQVPFQAIECRLLGIKPPGDQWTDFASNWLFDKCVDTASGAVKQMYVKYYTKEPGQVTGGNRYGVVIIDTNGDQDVIINQSMIDLNLAEELEDEIKYLQLSQLFLLKTYKDEQVLRNKVEAADDILENASKYSSSSESLWKPGPNMFRSKPIRSVPLVGSDVDCDDSDKWNINMTEDLARMFKPLIENSTREAKPQLQAIESNKPDVIDEIDIDSLAKNIAECSRQFQRVTKYDSSKDLDSDDFSSPETCHSASGGSEKAAAVLLDELRKPKLIWRQTKTTVVIKIQLIGVENYDLIIEQRFLKFAATLNDTNYGFEFDLYGVINSETATHSNKGQYILVKFNKILKKNWLTLTKDGGIRKWIVYDVDSIVASSEDEETGVDILYNVIKNMHIKPDSDSDDDFVDDVNDRHNVD